MLKWIAPLEDRLRHIQRPHMFADKGHKEVSEDRPSTGQIMAERVAALVGSWTFLGAQAGFLLLWLIFNTIAITGSIHFDKYPYILLNLLLSFQAAFTGPVLLIAANVGAIRDHAQSARIEKLSAQNETLGEQNEKLVDQMYQLEKMVDEHITASAKAHSAEIADLTELVRSIHATVCALSPNGGATTSTALVTSDGAAVPTESTIVAAPVAPNPSATSATQRSTSKRRRDSSNNSQS